MLCFVWFEGDFDLLWNFRPVESRTLAEVAPSGAVCATVAVSESGMGRGAAHIASSSVARAPGGGPKSLSS